jgi:DNA modification methylase
MSATYLLGDCLEVMKSLPDKSVDCYICDLPYGQLASGCSWDSKIDLAAFWVQVERLARSDNTPVIHFCNTRFGIDLINSKPSWFRYDLVWNKQRGVSFLLANKQPMKSHEMIYVFSKKGSYYKRIDEKTDQGDWKLDYTKGRAGPKSRQYGISSEKQLIREGKDGMRCPLSVVQFVSSVRSDRHPTEKPPALYRWLLERYCPPGGTVLDPTAGSFNSITVAEELGLHATGIEMSEDFFLAAVERSAKKNLAED